MLPIRLYGWTLRDARHSLFLSPQGDADTADEWLVVKQKSGTNSGQVLRRKTNTFDRVPDDEDRPDNYYHEYHPDGFINRDAVWVLEKSSQVNSGTGEVRIFNLRTFENIDVPMRDVCWNFSHLQMHGPGLCLLLCFKSDSCLGVYARCIIFTPSGSHPEYSYTELENGLFEKEYKKMPPADRDEARDSQYKASRERNGLSNQRIKVLEVLGAVPHEMIKIMEKRREIQESRPIQDSARLVPTNVNIGPPDVPYESPVPEMVTGPDEPSSMAIEAQPPPPIPPIAPVHPDNLPQYIVPPANDWHNPSGEAGISSWNNPNNNCLAENWNQMWNNNPNFQTNDCAFFSQSQQQQEALMFMQENTLAMGGTCDPSIFDSSLIAAANQANYGPLMLDNNDVFMEGMELELDPQAISPDQNNEFNNNTGSGYQYPQSQSQSQSQTSFYPHIPDNQYHYPNHFYPHN